MNFYGMKWFKYVALAYFILFLVLSSHSMSKKNCISSSIVKEIDIVHQGNFVLIPNCYTHKSIQGTMVLGDKKLLKSIQDNVSELESVIINNHLFMPFKKVKISLRQTGDYEIDSDKIIMSPGLALNDMALEQALTRAWLLNFSSKDVLEDKFLQTIFSDIYTYLFWNEKIVNTEDIQSHWIQYFYSEKDICKSPLAVPDQRAFCEAVGMIPKDKTLDNSFQNISIWSLRPFVLARFYESYENLSFKEKTQSLHRLNQIVTDFQWKASYDHLNFKKMATLFDKLMKSILPEGENILPTAFQLDAVIDGTLAATALKPENIPANSLIAKSTDEYWNPENHSLLRISQIEAKNWFIYKDSFPKLEDLRFLPVHIATVFVSGKETLRVHIPSLQLLAQYHYYDVLNLNLGQALKSHRLEDILGWNPVQVY